MNRFIKDPQAILDYQIDWSAWLGTDTISASAWTVTTGITVASSAFTATVTTIWLSGGTAGLSYMATNHITTAGGRQDNRMIEIVVQEK